MKIVPENLVNLPSISSDTAFWQDARDDENGLPSCGIGTRRISVFLQGCAEVSGLELSCVEAGRPLKVRVEAIRGDQSFVTIYEGELPWAEGVARLDFDAVEAFGMAILCTERSPLVPLHRDWYPSRFTVHYTTFEHLLWKGRAANGEIRADEPPPAGELGLERMQPSAPQGMECWTTPDEVHFRSRWIHVGFALRRPRMAWLSWDGLGTGRLDRNFLADNIPWDGDPPVTGPWFRKPLWPVPWSAWNGRAEVDGSRIHYRGLRGLDGIEMNLSFVVSEKGFDLKTTLAAERDQGFLEASPWRFVWEGKRTFSLSTWALPKQGCHRKGLVQPGGGFHAASRGTLTFQPVEPSEDASVLVDSTGYFGRQTSAALCIGVQNLPDGSCALKAGKHEAAWEFRVENVEPALAPGVNPDDPLVRGLRRGWSSVFLYRAEHAGLSNNSFSINAQNCIHFPADLAPLSQSPDPVPAMSALLRESLDLALRGGPGYGTQMPITSDTAPAQVLAAANVLRAEGEAAWVRKAWPFLARRVDHIIDHLDESGMYFNPNRTGNAHSYVSCANAWDTFVFGHHDGYGGALAYRALLEAPALAMAAGDEKRLAACEDAAPRLRAAYSKTLWNPETGRFAGWRSLDGALHDHGFVLINAMAVAFGIPDDSVAQAVMDHLEGELAAGGFTRFHHGVPPQLAPVPAADFYARSGARRSEVPYRADGADTFGIFTNGAITPIFAGYYLDALMRCGRTERARQIATELLPSFEAEVFDGCRNGAEGFTIDGLRSAYEGTLCHSFHVLLAAGKALGLLAPAP